jgi:hypothetical protein
VKGGAVAVKDEQTTMWRTALAFLLLNKSFLATSAGGRNGKLSHWNCSYILRIKPTRIN